MILALVLAAALAVGEPARAHETSPWLGWWTFDLCHEDRQAAHDNDTYCREGRDRIEVTQDSGGAYDITLCPSDPWGERHLVIDDGGRRLSFRTRDNMDVRLSLGDDRDHFRGTFRAPGGHAGRIWGKRVAGC